MKMISCVVCCSDNDKCLSDSDMKCSCEGICYVIWSGFCVSYYDCDFGICRNVTVIWTC